MLRCLLTCATSRSYVVRLRLMVIGPFIIFRLNPLASPRKPSVTIKWRSVDLTAMIVIRSARQNFVRQSSF